MRKIIYKLTVTAFSVLLTSCGKETAPDPPRSENRLVIELFNSLKNKDHDTTLKKIERLRILKPGNAFLIKLQRREEYNRIIIRLRQYLDEDNYIDAIEYIDKQISLYAKLKELKPLQKQVHRLAEISTLISLINKTDKASKLKKYTEKLKNLTKSINNKQLSEFIREKEILATQLSLVENKKFEIFDIILDIDEMYRTGNGGCWNDLAEVAAEDPDAPILKHYLGIIKGTEPAEPYILPAK